MERQQNRNRNSEEGLQSDEEENKLGSRLQAQRTFPSTHGTGIGRVGKAATGGVSLAMLQEAPGTNTRPCFRVRLTKAYARGAAGVSFGP